MADEVGVVGDGVGFLREGEKVGVGDEARLAVRHVGEVAAYFEIGGALPGAVEQGGLWSLTNRRRQGQGRQCAEYPGFGVHAIDTTG